jgi:hypothetical protein
MQGLFSTVSRILANAVILRRRDEATCEAMIGGAGLFLRYVRQRTDAVLVEAQDRSSCLAFTEIKHLEDLP